MKIMAIIFFHPGLEYRRFLEYELPGLMEEIAFRVQCRICYIYHGAKPHFSVVAREFLDQNNANRWIGRRGPHSWME